MASQFKKITDFLKSPQGRQLTEKAKTFARDPQNKAKAKEMFDKFKGGKGGSGGPSGTDRH